MKLRVLGLLAAFAFLTGTPASAQTNWSAGVKAGVNLSDIAVDPVDDTCCKRRTGAVGGLFVTVPINTTIGFQPEFLYSMKGATFEEDGEEFKIKTNYFEVPLLLRADFSSSASRPFVLFGPTLGFRTKATFEFPDGTEEDAKDDVEKFDVGFAIAGGLQFGRGSVEVRYTHGLSDADNSDDSKARHRVVSILAGFRF
jgi:hypothetical protein